GTRVDAQAEGFRPTLQVGVGNEGFGSRFFVPLRPERLEIVEQTAERCLVVLAREESSARPQQPSDLAASARGIRQVMENPVGHDVVEGSVYEGELACIRNEEIDFRPSRCSSDSIRSEERRVGKA